MKIMRFYDKRFFLTKKNYVEVLEDKLFTKNWRLTNVYIRIISK